MRLNAQASDLEARTSGSAWQMNAHVISGASPRLEQQDGHLSQVEVNEVLGFVRHIGAKIATNDGMPCGVVLLIELLLDEGSDVLLDVVLLKCLCRTIDGILLHVLCHVSIFDHSLTVRHRESRPRAEDRDGLL